MSQRQKRTLQDFANNVLEKKVMNMVKCIADATSRVNGWFFTGPRLTNFEIFLQRCIEQGEIQPFCVVAAHAQDKAYMDSKMSKDLMRHIFSAAVPMNSESVDDFDTLDLPSDLWNPVKNASHREFRSHGMDFWSFDACDQEESAGHPILQWPWPHADLFLLYYHQEASSDGLDVDWAYTTKRRLDERAVPLKPEMLAPSGYVFIGGGDASAKKRLLQLIDNVRPVVLLDNSSNVSKQVCLLLRIIKKAVECDQAVRPFFYDDRSSLGRNPSCTQFIQALSPSKIMRYLVTEFNPSGMDPEASLILSDVVAILDLVGQQHRLFKQRFLVLDPLFDAPSHALPQITSSFASATEQGAADGGVDLQSMAVKGWQMHSKLVRNAGQIRELATCLELVIALVMLLAVVLSVTMVCIRLRRDSLVEAMFRGSLSDQEIKAALGAFPFTKMAVMMNFWMIVLPITAGILISLRSHFKFSSKWASVHLAANQVVTEIYYLQGRTGRYSGPPEITGERFMRRLQDISTNLSTSGIREDDFQGEGDTSEVFKNNPKELQHHINRSLYGIEPPSWVYQRMQDVFRLPTYEWLLEDGQNPLQALTAELYVQTRLAPLTQYYKTWLKSAGRLRTRSNIALFVLLGVGSGLAAFGLSVWIPAALSAVTVLATLQHWMAPEEALAAVNSALNTLNTLEMRWQGSQRHDPEAMKHQLIGVTEKVVLAVATTLSRVSMMPTLDEFDNEEAGYLRVSTELLKNSSRRPSRSSSRSGSRAGSRAGSRPGSRPASRPSSTPGTPKTY
jgi:hypothetical protein